MSDWPRCCLCSRELSPAEAESTACHRCQDVIRGHLAALPDLAADLGGHLEPIRTAGPYVTGGGVEPPAPLNISALSLHLGGIATVLAAWEDSWRAEQGADPADATHARASATWLLGSLRWACSPAYPSQHLAEFATEIRQLHRDADRIVNPRTEPPTTVGRCPRTRDDDRPCGGRLQIPAGGTTLRCTRCATTWGSDHWLTLRRSIADAAEQTAA